MHLTEIMRSLSERAIDWSGVSAVVPLLSTLAGKVLYTKCAKNKYTYDARDVLDVLLQCMYVTLVLPVYFESSTPGRILICAVLHPMIYAGVDAHSRGVLLSLHGDCEYILRATTRNAHVKFFMSFARRIMMLSAGDARSTLLLILICAVEDLILRSCTVFIDKTLRRARGLNAEDPELKGSQHAVWVSDTSTTCISELVGIISAPMFSIMLQPHALALNLGYSPYESISSMTLFIHLLLQLFAELSVDNISSWIKTENGIDVFEFYSRISSGATLAAHTSFTLAAWMIVLYAFVRHPTFATCDSYSVCNCVYNSNTFGAWYAASCNRTNGTMHWENSTTYIEDKLFEGVDSNSAFVTLATAIGIIAVISLSVLMARSKKRSKVAAVLLQRTKTINKDFLAKRSKV